MKKTLAIIALALFIGGTSATAIAATIDSPQVIELREDDKKKAKKSKKKSEATKKSSDCAKTCEEQKEKDCSKTCGEKK